jgi:hypothetical protein
MKGTGRRWSGVHYGATIVDIRDGDDSVKVRYTDGGYKRFPRTAFQNLLVPDEQDNYAFRAYELFDDVYDPTTEALDQATKLREQLTDAVKAQDFKSAADLQKAIQQKIQNAEILKAKRQDMLRAVQKEDFHAASEIKNEIDSLSTSFGSDVVAAAEQEGGVDVGEIFAKAKKRALGGGLAGASAMVIQVTSLMWMRTTMNYQYRNGGTFKNALNTLYAEGGIRRFYKGIGPGLIQGPMSRFGDTASNTGMLALLNALPATRDIPVVAKTVAASLSAASFRIFLMPVDSLKTSLQVEGNLNGLKAKLAQKGPLGLYHGSLAAAAATFAGHFPWWATYNLLDERVPKPDGLGGMLARQAGMGFISSIVSDTTSNSIRVVKTVKQTDPNSGSYASVVKGIVAKDGLKGLFFRGLGTRLLSNAAQGIMFSVLWKYIDKTFFQ